jgi:hypothetical protein
VSMTVGNLNTLRKLAETSGLPPFQRGYVWTPEQAELLLDSVTRGYPIGSILVWDPDTRASRLWAPERGLILDGQQRLTALTGLRPGGQRVHSVGWHFAEARWRVYPGEPAAVPHEAWALEGSTVDLMDAFRSGRFPRGAERAYSKAYDALRFNSQVPIHSVIGPAADAVEAFRRVNAGGTPISADELAVLTTEVRS